MSAVDQINASVPPPIERLFKAWAAIEASIDKPGDERPPTGDDYNDLEAAVRDTLARYGLIKEQP